MASTLKPVFWATSPICKNCASITFSIQSGVYSRVKRENFSVTIFEMAGFGFELPSRLKRLEASPDGRDWLRQLPSLINACVQRWALRLEPPYQQTNGSGVFPATTAEGLSAVVK